MIANCFLADMFQYAELPSYTDFSFPLKRLVMFASTTARDYAFSIKLYKTISCSDFVNAKLKKTVFLAEASPVITLGSWTKQNV